MVLSKTRIKITLNTVAQFIGRLTSSGSTFIITILLARSLGADGYGDFSKIIAYIGFFYLFVDFGINAAFLRLHQEDNRFAFSHLLGLRIALSILLVFVAISILHFFPQGSTQGYTPIVRLGIILYTGSIITHAIITSCNAIFQQHLRYDLSAIAVVAGSIIRLGLIATVGFFSVVAAIFCFFIASVANAAIALLLTKHLAHDIVPRFSFSYAMKLFFSAIPLGLTLMFNVVYFRVDTIIITLTQSTQDVGVYNLAYNMFEVALVIPTFFMNTMYPLLLQAKEQSLERFFVLSKKASLVLTFSSFIVFACVWLSAPLLSLIKPEFGNGVSALRALGLSLPLFYLTSLTMWMMVTLKSSTALLGIYGLSMIGNIVANSVFVPRFGFMAAAWITVVGEFVVLLLSFLMIARNARQTMGLRRILAS